MLEECSGGSFSLSRSLFLAQTLLSFLTNTHKHAFLFELSAAVRSKQRQAKMGGVVRGEKDTSR